MKANPYRLAGVIIGISAILPEAIPGRAQSPPYSAPVIQEAEFAVKNGQIEVTLKGLFHAGAKTATASCEPSLKNLQFDSTHVQVVHKPRPGDDDDPRRGPNMAEAAKILLPIFVTGPAGAECVFILRDEEPSSRPASQRTSAPLRARVVTDNLTDFNKEPPPDPSGPPRACSEDEKIGSNGLPEDPAAVVVVGDIVYANATAPYWWYNGTVRTVLWSHQDGLQASDFDLFAIPPAGERKKLTVNMNDFSSEKMPLSIGVVVDASGSMRDTIEDGRSYYPQNLTKRSLAERAATRILSNALQAGRKFIPPKDPKNVFDKGIYIPLSNAFVMNFNEDFILNGEENPTVSARHFVMNENQLNSWITGKGSGGGVVLRSGTRLLDAVYRSAYEMNRIAALESCKPDPRIVDMRNQMENNRHERANYTYQETRNLNHLIEEVSTVKRRRVLFVISDGRENGSKLTLDKVVEYLSKSGVVLYGINYGKDAAEVGASVLPELAQATGGQALVVNLRDSTAPIEDQVDNFTYTVVAALEHQYELTFEETLDKCSQLEMHAYDSSKLLQDWRAMEEEFKRKTCQLEPAISQNPKPVTASDGSPAPVITAAPEKPACVPDSHASLVPWERYYADHARDKDLRELRVTHRNYVGPCSPAEIHALINRDKVATPPPNRRKRK